MSIAEVASTVRRTVPCHPARADASFQEENVDEVGNPLPSWDEPQEPSDLEVDIPSPDDDSLWDVFIPDDDEIDPQPEANDFWTTQD